MAGVVMPFSRLKNPSLAKSLLAATFVLVASTLSRSERLPIKLYTTADGLWSSSTNYLMRDSHGFIWFCTRDGLSRFDGYRFINYRIGTGSSYPTYLLETHKGVYWIALNGGGLYRYDPTASTSTAASAQPDTNGDDPRVVLDAELVSQENFSTLFEDRQGNLWAATSGLSLIEDNNGKVSFRQIELNLPEELNRGFFRIYAISEGQDGSLWLGTTQGLMRRLPDGRIAHFTISREGDFDLTQNLLADREGRIWIGHNSGYYLNSRLYVLKPEPLEAFTASGAFISRSLRAHPPTMRDGHLLLPDAAGEAVDYTSVEGLNITAQLKSTSAMSSQGVFGIYQASDGLIWVGFSDALAVFDGQRFHTYTTTQGLVETGLVPLAEDRDGGLWIASIDGPLKLSVQGLKTYDRTDGLTHAEIQSIYEDRNGFLHVVNSNWFISRLDDRRFNAVRPNISPDVGYSWSSNVAFLDHFGEWWFLTNNGLYRFAHVNRLEDLAHRQPTAVFTERNGLKSKNTYCMFEDSRGDLWISTRVGGDLLNGLSRWQRSTETFHTFSEADGLPSRKSASSFAEDKAGNLWFGFYQGGLVRYKAGRFTSFTSSDVLPEGFITGLHVDQRGRLWLTSSSEGLSRVDDPTAEHPHFAGYTTREGLSINNARCITEDLAGRIYVGTVRGVDRMTPETGKFKHYRVSDGLAADWVKCAYRDRQGALWFGTFNGLSRFDPQTDREPTAPSISISGLRIAGVKQQLSEFGRAEIAGLELSATQNDLQIDFSSLSIGHAELLRYQYKLEGADSDWSTPADQRTVNYANLGPGAYRFLVRAVDPDGLTSPQPASVSFRILGPIWRRWWFLTLAMVAVVLAAYSLYRYRVGRLIELERVRTRIATDLHDDIGSSLSQVSVLSEVIRRRIGPDPTVSEPLKLIAGLSRDLVDSMNDIVWAINPRRDYLSDLTQRMRRFASDVFTARDIEFTFSAPSSQHDMKLGADMRREVFLILKESVNNAVRHSGCTEVDIEFSIKDGWLKLEVSDNGKGFDPHRVNDGNGLTSMRQRAKKIGGVLELVANNGHGTKVKLKASLGRSGWRRK